MGPPRTERNGTAVTERVSLGTFIGLGSNLDHPVEQVGRAVTELDQLPASRVDICSSLYRSAPLGPPGQPDYINAVARLITSLSAQDLLSALQDVERRHGRDRSGTRWGPRTLDLDLLLYGDRVINEPGLTVPHPGMVRREFVLYPLYEIAPLLHIPGQGWLKDCIRQCPGKGLQKLELSSESSTP